MPWFFQSKVRYASKALPYVFTLGLFVFVLIELVKLNHLLQDLKPDEFLRNATVVQRWRKVVVGGPWDIKHMMSGPFCVFVLGPLALVTLEVFPLAKFPFITANVISFIHVILSLASFRLLLSPKLCRRRIGAIFFFLRQYFDELDGMVARFWMARHMHTPGRLGFWIDGLSDTVSVIVLIISFFVLIHRSHDGNSNNGNSNNGNFSQPVDNDKSSTQYDDFGRLDDVGGVTKQTTQRRGCRSCGEVAVVVVGDDDNDDSLSSFDDSFKDDEMTSDSDESLLLNSKTCRKKAKHAPVSLSASTSPYRYYASTLQQYLSTRLIHRKTLMVVGVIATLSLSCSVWNNACYIYMDLLDTQPKCPRKRQVQLNILKSWLSFLVFHCWRVCMPLAFILQCALAIFMDKTVAFAAFVTRIYFWFVVALAILTVAHLSEIKDVLNDGHLCA